MELRTRRLCDFYRRVVRMLFGLAAAWLFVSCLAVTNYIDLNEHSWLSPDTTFIQCLLFIALCAMVSVLYSRISFHVQRISLIRWTLILLAGLLAGFWVGCTRLSPIPHIGEDAYSVQYAASQFLQGEYYQFQPGDYMAVYPHQSGLLLVHCLLAILFPGAADTTLPFQILNVFCYMGILYLLGEFAKELGLRASGCLAVTLLGIFFTPLLFYVSFVYGTLPGLCFALAGFLFTVYYCDYLKARHALLSTLFLSLAMLFKSNYQIFFIAAILYILYRALCAHHRCWLLLPLLVLGWFLANKGPVLFLEVKTGYSLHNGFSSLSWIAMGLRTDSPYGPGWFDEYPLISYAEANMDPSVQSTIALNCISGIVQGYIMHPAEMLRFFAEKNATQWSEPFFQSIWINQKMYQASSVRFTGIIDTFLASVTPGFLSYLLNGLQTLIYGGLVLWAWIPTSEKRNPTEDLLAVTLLGGFIFHSFWEAKSQYTFPYVVLVFPLALLGYRRLGALLSDTAYRKLLQPVLGKIRFLAPLLLMGLALILSLFFSKALHDNLIQFVQTAS